MTKSKYTRKEYTIAEAAYMAGLMDGEGTFFIGNYGNTRNGFFQTVLKITSTDKCMIEWVYITFGGWMSEYTSKQRAINCKCPVFTWACTGDRLTHICEIMLPFLTAKKQQALILIKMRGTYNGSEYVKGKQGVQKLPAHILNLRLELMKHLQSLHCRNYTLPI
jgi:hypothetical protein